MLSIKRVSTVGSIAILGLTLAIPAFAAKKGNITVLVVPARHTVVRFAFDIAAIRDVTLVAYGGETPQGEQLLHVWNAEAKKWTFLSMDEFSFGQFLPDVPDTVILIGASRDMPEFITANAPAAKRVINIPSINPMPMANRLNERMRFSPREWRMLAKRHGLKIKDLNEERRRYGRYGPPGKRVERPRAADPEPVVEDAPEPTVIEETPPAREPIALEEKGMEPAEPEVIEEDVDVVEAVAAPPASTRTGVAPVVEEPADATVDALPNKVTPEETPEEPPFENSANEILDTLETEANATESVVEKTSMVPPAPAAPVRLLAEPEAPIILPAEASPPAAAGDNVPAEIPAVAFEKGMETELPEDK